MSRPDVQAARRAATILIEQFKIAAPPVPVEQIARRLGIKIQFAPFDGDLSGMAFIKDGVPIIGVNSLHHPNRQRFTLAHELAHIQLHRPQIEAQVHVDNGSLRRDALAAEGVDPTEIEANAFASEILIPALLLKTALGGRTIDLEDDAMIAALAKKFKVSEAAMRFRFQ
ncbi:MAG TPA: ImmA/IrrE family metallo-endopeptidase [Pirellulales bacterium]|jgi:Zn-dependent peptidase ImmA (M78 family)